MLKVLVVEDEVRLADTVRRGLTADGFNVEVVHDGVEGRWRAKENSYDVIILEHHASATEWLPVCVQLRTAQVWTPVLMLTAKDGSTTRLTPSTSARMTT